MRIAHAFALRLPRMPSQSSMAPRAQNPTITAIGTSTERPSHVEAQRASCIQQDGQQQDRQDEHHAAHGGRAHLDQVLGPVPPRG